MLEQIARMRELMGDRGFVVLRSPIGQSEADLSIPGFHGPEIHRYGQEMHVLLYSPAPIESKAEPGEREYPFRPEITSRVESPGPDAPEE